MWLVDSGEIERTTFTDKSVKFETTSASATTVAEVRRSAVQALDALGITPRVRKVPRAVAWELEIRVEK